MPYTQKVTFLLLALCFALPACKTTQLDVPQTVAPRLALPEADITFPNDTHRLMFTAYGNIYTMLANGVGLQALTTQAEATESMVTWSPDGTRIAFVSDREGNDEIYITSANAPGDIMQQMNITYHPAQDCAPAWSPDGYSLAFSSSRDNSWGIFVMELGTNPTTTVNPMVSGPIRCSYNLRLDTHPAWSPDGQFLAYTSDRGYYWQIYRMKRDGSEQQAFPGMAGLSNTAYPDWSPDGTRIAFASNYQKNWDIYTLDVNGNDLVQMTDHPAQDWGPRWSPDGQWIAFSSNRSGDGDLYLVKSDGSQELRLTDYPGPELFPAWGPVN